MFEYQSQMSNLIQDLSAPPPTGWRCGNRIDVSLACEIYRRNLHVGVALNLGSNFPVCRAYIGEAGFARIVKLFIQQQPESSPVFRTLAVQFPEFISITVPLPEPLRECLAPLAVIEFISICTNDDEFRLPMDLRFLELYQMMNEIDDALQTPVEGEGLYSLPHLHPETVLSTPTCPGTMTCRFDGTSTLLSFEAIDLSAPT